MTDMYHVIACVDIWKWNTFLAGYLSHFKKYHILDDLVNLQIVYEKPEMSVKTC